MVEMSTICHGKDFFQNFYHMPQNDYLPFAGLPSVYIFVRWLRARTLCNIAISDTNYEAVKITDIFLSALFQPGRREEGRGQRALQDEELQGRAAAILGGHQ